MNVRIGSLAIVIRGGIETDCPEMIGRIVEVVSPAIPGEIFTSTTGLKLRYAFSKLPAWVVTSSSPMPWKAICGPCKGCVFMFNQRAIFDANLQQINGPDLADEVLGELSA